MAKNAANANEVATNPEEVKTEVVNTEEVKAEAAVSAKANASGFYCYIGPNIARLIKHGDVYFGTRAEALEQAKAAIEKKPLIKTLIVSGDDLPAARLKVKTPGNALYNNAKRVAARDEERKV